MYQQQCQPLVDHDSFNSIDNLRNIVIGNMHALNEAIKHFNKKHQCGTKKEKELLEELSLNIIGASKEIKEIHSIV